MTRQLITVRIFLLKRKRRMIKMFKKLFESFKSTWNEKSYHEKEDIIASAWFMVFILIGFSILFTPVIVMFIYSFVGVAVICFLVGDFTEFVLTSIWKALK